jgi:hypothetical protein
VTILARNAALAGLTVDTGALYRGDDTRYMVWLDGVIGEVGEARQQQAERAKREAGGQS